MSSRFGVPRWGTTQWLLLEIPPIVTSRLATYLPRSYAESVSLSIRPTENSRTSQVNTVSSQVRTGSSV